MPKETSIAPIEQIEKAILLVRGQKVMLDADLAELYGVETKTLNRAVKRNIERFPDDFMFQLTEEEAKSLRFHSGTSKVDDASALKAQFATSNLKNHLLSKVVCNGV